MRPSFALPRPAYLYSNSSLHFGFQYSFSYFHHLHPSLFISIHSPRTCLFCNADWQRLVISSTSSSLRFPLFFALHWEHSISPPPPHSSSSSISLFWICLHFSFFFFFFCSDPSDCAPWIVLWKAMTILPTFPSDKLILDSLTLALEQKPPLSDRVSRYIMKIFHAMSQTYCILCSALVRYFLLHLFIEYWMFFPCLY